MDLLYELKSSLLTILPPSFWDIIDIAVLSYLIYKVIQFMKETRAGGLAKGIIVLVLCYMLARIMQMKALTFILDKTFDVGLLAIIIIFQPELRRSLEKVGHSKLSKLPVFSNSASEGELASNGHMPLTLSANPAKTFQPPPQVRSSLSSVRQSLASR